MLRNGGRVMRQEDTFHSIDLREKYRLYTRLCEQASVRPSARMVRQLGAIEVDLSGQNLGADGVKVIADSGIMSHDCTVSRMVQ